MRHFEEYLLKCAEEGITEFRMVCTVEKYDTKVMIHPLNQSGETIDLIVDEDKTDFDGGA